MSNYNPDSINAVLSRIEEKLETIGSDIKESKKATAAIEKRVSVLEYFKYYLVGFAAFFAISFDWAKDIFRK